MRVTPATGGSAARTGGTGNPHPGSRGQAGGAVVVDACSAAAGLASAVDATAENLPFDDGTFDAAMAKFSVHQWGDLLVGLREIRRATGGPIAVLT